MQKLKIPTPQSKKEVFLSNKKGYFDYYQELLKNIH